MFGALYMYISGSISSEVQWKDNWTDNIQSLELPFYLQATEIHICRWVWGEGVIYCIINLYLPDIPDTKTWMEAGKELEGAQV